MGDKKSARLEIGIWEGIYRGDFGILRNEFGGFVFEKREEGSGRKGAKTPRNHWTCL
jgi:hypothetical protein